MPGPPKRARVEGAAGETRATSETPSIEHALQLLAGGQQLYASGRSREALEPLTAALGSFRETHQRHYEATTLTELGRAYARQAQYEEAISQYRAALNLFEERGDKRGQAIVLTNLGVVRDEIEELDEARAMFQRALECFRAVGDEQQASALEGNLAALDEEEADPSRPYRVAAWSARLFERGAFGEAVKAGERARSMFREKGDRIGEAGGLGNLGVFSQRLGRFQDALDRYEEALAIYRDAGDQKGEARTLSSLGSLYGSIGEPDEAVKRLEEALAIPRERFDAGGTMNAVSALTNLGTIQAEAGRPTEALRSYERAHALLQELDDAAAAEAPTVRKLMGLQYRVADTLQNLGTVYHDLERSEEALERCEEALAIRRELGDRGGEGETLSAIGSILSSLGRIDEALEHYEKARAFLHEVGNQRDECAALNSLGNLHRILGHREEALKYFESAIEIVEGMRGELMSEELRRSYFATAGDLYATYASLLVELGEDERALHAAERGRGRAFLDLLVEARAEIHEGVSPGRGCEERRLLSELSALRQRLAESRSQPEDERDASLISQLERRGRDLELQIHTLEAQIRREDPRYAALTQPTAWTVTEIREKLLDRRTVLLEYMLADPNSMLFCLTVDELKVFTLPARKEIETKVWELRTAIVSYLHRYPHGHELYRALLQPAADLIREKDLLICADGALHYLPFAALLTETPEEVGRATDSVQRSPAGDGEHRASRHALRDVSEKVEADMDPLPPFDYRALPYLLREHAIAYAPSGTVAGMVREAVGLERRSYDATLAAFADPRELDGNGEVNGRGRESSVPDGLAAAIAHTRSKLTRIPKTADEVWALATLLCDGPLPEERPESFDRGSIALRTAGAATKREAEGLTSGELSFRFFHVATHGLLDPEKPQFSGLVFTRTDDGDPFWRTFEIFNAHIRSELVVLSACETGLGKIVSGEGIVGLTRAFLYAGAATVCVSLWEVAEASTPKLMHAFYKRILGGESKAKALQGAQLDLLGEESFSHPYWWAPFVIVGERGRDGVSR